MRKIQWERKVIELQQKKAYRCVYVEKKRLKEKDCKSSNAQSADNLLQLLSCINIRNKKKKKKKLIIRLELLPPPPPLYTTTAIRD